MTLLLRKIASLLQLCIGILSIPFQRKQSETPKHILIVQMAKLGDMVCTTPMFRAVKEKYPDSHLLVLGDAVNKNILQGNPYIDTYLVKIKSYFKTFKLLRTYRIDAMFLTVPNLEMLSVALVLRIPLIVVPEVVLGFSPYETRSYRFLRKFVITKPHHMGSYAPREYLRLLEPIGIFTEDTRKEVYFSREAEKYVQSEFLPRIPKGSFTIGILPGAGNEIKSWPPEYFGELMLRIGEKSAVTFILLGAEKDRDRADSIIEHVDQKVSVIDAIGIHTIDTLKASIKVLDLVIGADTGPQYIAEALSVPTIDIVGPVDEREQPPRGEFHHVVVAERKRAELQVLNARMYNHDEAVRQVRDISPEMVYAQYLTLRDKIEKQKHHAS